MRQVLEPERRQGKWQEPHNAALLRDALSDIHCFEVTTIISAFDDLAGPLGRMGQDRTELLFEAATFLPAPKTWLEWSSPRGRTGLLLEEYPGPRDGRLGWSRVTFFDDQGAFHLGYVSSKSNDFLVGEFPEKDKVWFPADLVPPGATPLEIIRGVLSMAHILLLFINSPKVTDHTKHPPHKRLVREAPPGFPLHTWGEIRLRVTKPPNIDDGLPHEPYLTSRRALHFVRRFMRVRLGRLEYVTAHWRGDPTVGVHHSDYRVST
jgi:hypothetical protein